MIRNRLSLAASGAWMLCMVSFFSAAYGDMVGNYVSHTHNGNQIDFTVANGKVRIYICTPNIARVSFDTRATGTFTSTRDILGMDDVNRTWPDVAGLAVADSTPGTTGTVEIKTSAMTIRVAKNPFRISYYKADGTSITNEAAAMNSNGASQGSPTFTFTQGTNEHYFGWGLAFEQYRSGYHKADNKGSTYSTRRSTALYMYSTGGYGIWLLFAEPWPNASQWGDITNPTQGCGFDLRGATAKYWMNSSTDPANGGTMEYASYFIFVGNWKEAMSGYTEVSGRPPKLGKKWYGYMRDLYYKAGTSVTTFKGWADMYRKERFNMDWVRMDNFFDWTNLGYLPSVPNSGCWNNQVEDVVKYYDTLHYNFGGMSAGWGFYGCCSANCTNNLLEDSAHAKTAMDHGFDFAWYDAMNYQSRKIAHDEWDVWQKAHGGDETKVMISRGWQALSTQSWPGNHMGDYLNNPYIYAVFPSALQEHLVGYAFSHCDLGEGYDFGYMGYTLRPMVTIHMAGAAGGTATNFEECGTINSYATDLKDCMKKWANWHYRFIPYLFTYGMIANATGIPPTRGMMCQNSGETDSKTWNLLYQAYVGEELIWSPYYKDNPDDNNSGARKSIYLPPIPSGVWYDYFDGTKYASGTSGAGFTIASYTCDPGTGRANLKLPVFVKAGAMVPLMDTLQYIGERAESLITVQVWPTNGNAASQSGSFTLYEDEGVWNQTTQTRGPASQTPLSYTFTDDGTDQQTVVSIGAFAGSAYCPQSKRVWRVEVHNVKQVTRVKSGSVDTWIAPITQAQYDAGTAGFYWDTAKGGICSINAVGDPAAGFNVYASTKDVSVRPMSAAAALSQKISIVRVAGSIRVTVPYYGSHVVDVFNAQGKVLIRERGDGAAIHTIFLGQNAPLVYLVRVSAPGKQFVKKLML
jgi:alpha-glucosidase (family GH31 glycosyl hydrolase)